MSGAILNNQTRLHFVLTAVKLMSSNKKIMYCVWKRVGWKNNRIDLSSIKVETCGERHVIKSQQAAETARKREDTKARKYSVRRTLLD